MIYYNILAANIFTCYLLLRVFFFKCRKAQLVIFSVTLIIILIGCFTNIVNFIYFIPGFVSYLSTASTLLMLIILISQFIKSKTYTFGYTSIAFLILVIVFYGSFALDSYYLYHKGFNPFTIAISVYVYAVILFACSRKFLLFNIIIIVSSLLFFTSLLQDNIWNYLVDPILLLVCLIELISALMNKLFNKNKMAIVSH